MTEKSFTTSRTAKCIARCFERVTERAEEEMVRKEEARAGGNSYVRPHNIAFERFYKKCAQMCIKDSKTIKYHSMLRK